MPKLKAILLFFSIVITYSSFLAAQPPAACHCIWQGAFVEVAEQADFIISATVVAQKGNSIDVEIDKRFQDKGVGQQEFRQRIRIWGDDGKRCRPAVDSFSVDSQWLLALKKITEMPDDGFNPNTPNISFGRINDYYLSSCGAYWLRLQDDYVSGPLVTAERWQWQDDNMNPVLIDLVGAYLQGVLPKAALTEAAKPQTEAKRLLEETKNFLRQQ